MPNAKSEEVVENRGSRRGGKRPGAGRKKTGVRRGGAHRRRPELSPNHPVHVTMKIDRRRPELRNHRIYRVVRRVLFAMIAHDGFRVVHISIQNNHLHLIIEAENRAALTRGMRSLTMRLQRGIAGKRGNLFPWRYHATQIKTARQARRTLAYVLNNWRRHRLDWDDRGRHLPAKLDEFSSAVSFDGWQGGAFRVPAGHEPLPVARPRTWLLRVGWTSYGRIDPFERPGPIW